MRLRSDGFHDIHPYVSLFVILFFRQVTPGNILMRYGGNGTEKGDRPPLLSITMTRALISDYLEGECDALLLGRQIEQDIFIRTLEANHY